MGKPANKKQRREPSQPLKGKLESFAQGRAAGYSGEEALLRAGYLGGSVRSRTLESRPGVRARINYLTSRAAGAERSRAQASDQRTFESETPPEKGPNAEWVIKELVKNYLRAGNESPIVSNRTLQLIGAQLGMFKTPYTPVVERINVLGHVEKAEVFAYMAEDIGYEKAQEILTKITPPPGYDLDEELRALSELSEKRARGRLPPRSQE